MSDSVDKGLIPAHAGKTANRAPRYCTVTAHPRSRGENNTADLQAEERLGSSPLTRGKRQKDVAVQDLEGLIPAHAGKTLRPSSPTSASGAHPRSRGENLVTTGSYDGNLGSSPLTRGKLAHVVLAVAVGGLIPAHAGKTWLLAQGTLARRAHPRSRGENQSDPVGSGVIQGLIPAHAGKTEQ